MCNIQPIQRSHGQSGFQLHPLYPKYHKVKTNRKGQFVSGSFLNIPLLLQSQGIGTFPAWKMQSTKETTTLKYSGSSVPQQNHKVMKVMKESSMSNYNKARLKKLIFGETQEFQHHWSQGTKYQLQMLNKYLNFHLKKHQKSFICPKVRGMKNIQVQKRRSLTIFARVSADRKSKLSTTRLQPPSKHQEQKSYNLLQEVQQPENHLCHQHFTKQNVAAYITSGVESNSNVTEKTIQNQKSSEQFYGQLHPSFSHLQDKVKAGQGSLNPHTVHKKKWAKSSPKKVKVKHKTMMLMLMILS